MDAVKGLAAGSPVVIFSKTNCCMSFTIDSLIRGYGANPMIYELDQLPNGHQMEREFMALGCNPSVPAVFIGKEFIGGSNEVMSLNIKGILRQLLIRSGAIWV